MSRTLVVTDLDGSFWDKELRCHPDTMAAVAELQADDVPILVATGRRAASARAGLAGNGLEFPAVLLNGALGIDFRYGLQFHQQPFAIGAAAEVIAGLADVGLFPVMYLADGTARGPEHVTTSDRHRSQLMTDFVADDVDEVLANHQVLGFSMIGLPQAQLEPALAAVSGATAGVDLYRDSLFDAWSVHFQPVGISKWDGIQAYLAHQGLRPERIVVVGDNTNDLEMLEQADVALGVEGGHERALAIADTVIGHPGDGGWAAVLDHLA